MEDNSKLVGTALERQVEDALYVMGVNAVEGIVKYMSKPDFTGKDIVETGRLRASISFVTPKGEMKAQDRVPQEGDVKNPDNQVQESDYLKGSSGEKRTVIVGSNVEYASYVDQGTKKLSGDGLETSRPARQFMKNGIEAALPKMRSQVEDILKGGS